MIKIDFVEDNTLKGVASVVQTSRNGYIVKYNPNKNVSYEILAHEMSHIYIDALGYNSSIVQEGIKQAKEGQLELWTWVQDKYSKLYNNQEELEKELLVQVIGKEAQLTWDNKTVEKNWLDFIKDFFKSIGDF